MYQKISGAFATSIFKRISDSSARRFWTRLRWTRSYIVPKP